VPEDEKLEPIMKKLKYEDRVPHRARQLFKQIVLHFGRNAHLYGVEVGVERGITTEVLLKYLPNLRLCAIDAWLEGLDKKARLTRPKMTQVEHDDNLIETLKRVRPYRDRCRVVWSLSEDVVDKFHSGETDFVFLDGNHSYEGVRLDLCNWWRIVRAGGMLCGDDYGGRMEKHEFAGWGVKKAVDEFVKCNDLKLNTAPMNFFWVQKER